MDLFENTIASRRIHEGRIINLREDTVEMPGGRSGRREIVEHRGAVCIVPELPTGEVMLVRQYRKPAEKALWELPAGGLNEGEDPLACALRELREECGLEGELEPLFQCWLAPGYSTELMYGYLGRNLNRVACDPEDDEVIETRAWAKPEIIELISRNGIEDAKTLCGLLLWLQRR